MWNLFINGCIKNSEMSPRPKRISKLRSFKTISVYDYSHCHWSEGTHSSLTQFLATESPLKKFKTLFYKIEIEPISRSTTA